MKKIFITILLTILSVLLFQMSVSPLISKGYFPMHDDTQVARVLAMAKALSDGMLPVRWVDYLGYGYGYPIFNFYAPLPYYVGALSQLIGFDPLSATKIMFGLGMIVAGITMFVFARSIWGKAGGFFSAIFYLYTPYHAVQLYVRGAIGELWAYAFTPLVFYGLYRLFRVIQKETGSVTESSKLKSSRGARSCSAGQISEPQLKTQKFIWPSIAIFALAYAALILSHNLTALMVTPFIILSIIICGVVFYKQKKPLAIFYMLFAILLGLLLSAFYWLPALVEMEYTNVASILGGKSNPLDHFVCLSQLWQSNWGFAGSASGCIDGMSFALGKPHIFLTLFGLGAVGLLLRKKSRHELIMLIIAYVIFLTSIFLMLDMSRFVWQSLSAMQYIQFPWRFLVLAIFASSFIIGGVFWVIFERYELKRNIYLALIAAAILSASLILYTKYFVPQYQIEDTKRYTDISIIKWDTSKISDEYLPKRFHKPRDKDQIPSMLAEVTSGDAKVTVQKNKTQLKELNVSAKTRSTVTLNIVAFPAWKLWVDGKPQTLMQTDGLYFVTIEPGEHYLRLVFVSTPIEKLGNILTLLGFTGLIAGIILGWQRKAL